MRSNRRRSREHRLVPKPGAVNRAASFAAPGDGSRFQTRPTRLVAPDSCRASRASSCRPNSSSTIDAEGITLDPRPSSRSALAVFGGKPRKDLPNRSSPLDDGSHAHPSESHPSRAPAYSPDDCRAHRAVLTRHLRRAFRAQHPRARVSGGRSLLSLPQEQPGPLYEWSGFPQQVQGKPGENYGESVY